VHHTHNSFLAGHKCYVCDGNIHSALLCGMGLDAYLMERPAFPVNFKCKSGNIIVRGDDSNEMRAVCFQCINQLAHTQRTFHVQDKEQEKLAVGKHHSPKNKMQLCVCNKCDAEWPN
jgi:hypothetical protein